MPSIEALMEMLATMILFVLIATVLLQAFLAVKDNEVSFGNAYQMTQKIVYTINALSAGPQNESATLSLNTAKYKIDFDEENNYVESETDLLGSAKYGLFVFKDIELVAQDIDCISDPGKCPKSKTLLFQKEVLSNGNVKIKVSEIGETAPGPRSKCSDQTGPTGVPCICKSFGACTGIFTCITEKYECGLIECCCCTVI